ncbi:GNAT family N-acetyltransferase [Psychromarinibacter sp. C21-152]|uniref:GNAT family N-acetyltransferase n=1 Tax=Psychromarinibacter sediminicola TaxID=3033385 RepID=A0AAE3T9F1_9RHOB|nr:GNAT family N-acetyltransferase [Psychromarinibacter sediminicola]MDF0600954.1 GNAT family N-acetyltransferase [Psychromarinibacter sediminicola]
MQDEREQAVIGLPKAGIAAMPELAKKRYAAFMQRDVPEVARDWMQVDAFMARIDTLDASKIGLLHELTISVFWPHRAPDLELFLRMGHGYIAVDEIGRPLGSAMSFKSGEDFAMCGMMVTTPRLQAHGAGRRLLRRVMADCSGCDLRLSATREGYRLYESAGFVPVGPVYQHQGVARTIHAPEPVPGLTVRPAEPRDFEAIRALDAHAYGAPRSGMLDVLCEVSETLVAERGGAAIGFAMLRDFGKGKVIGPVIAEADEIAMHLAAPFVMAHAGTFLRFDTPVESDRFSAFLAAAGLGVYDTVTEMRLGRMRRALSGPVVYGLATHSLG